MEENAEQIRFSRFLATIKTDVPVTLDMDALRREQPDEETLRKLFEDLEFKSLIDRLFKKEKAPLPPPSDQGTLFALFDAASQEEPATPSRLSHLEDLPYRYHLVETDADRGHWRTVCWEPPPSPWTPRRPTPSPCGRNW